MTVTAVQPVRVYADTSVYGGVFDKEFAKPSGRFFDLAVNVLHRLLLLEIRSPLEVIENAE